MKEIFIAIIILSLLAAPLAAADKKPNLIIPVTLSFSLAVSAVVDTQITMHGVHKHGFIETNGLLRGLVMDKKYFALYTIQAIGTAAIIGGAFILITSKDKTTKIIGYGLLIAANIGRWWIIKENLELHHRYSK